jgi:hypothetical protein
MLVGYFLGGMVAIWESGAGGRVLPDVQRVRKNQAKCAKSQIQPPLHAYSPTAQPHNHPTTSASACGAAALGVGLNRRDLSL